GWWRNHTGNQSCRPRAIVRPGSLQDLIDLVQRAESEGTTVRAVGAGHAWSDVGLTDGYLVLPDRLGGVARPEEGELREEARGRFWLNEVRTLSTWEAVRDTLTEDGVLGEGDHYELFLNPYPGDDGRLRVLVTTRRDCPAPSERPPDKLERHPLTELESSL